jgi:hypothetical protein
VRVRLINNVATTVARPYASGFLPVGIRGRHCLRPPPTFPIMLHQLRAEITDATAHVNADMLTRMK